MTLRALEARLTRLEARIWAIPDPEEQEAREKLLLTHLEVWLFGGTLEGVPEKDRDPSLWRFVSKYGHVFLKMIWQGSLDGRDELLAAGVDFTGLEGVDEDDVAAARASGIPGQPGPDVHPKVGENLSSSDEEG